MLCLKGISCCGIIFENEFSFFSGTCKRLGPSGIHFSVGRIRNLASFFSFSLNLAISNTTYWVIHLPRDLGSSLCHVLNFCASLVHFWKCGGFDVSKAIGLDVYLWSFTPEVAELCFLLASGSGLPLLKVLPFVGWGSVRWRGSDPWCSEHWSVLICSGYFLGRFAKTKLVIWRMTGPVVGRLLVRFALTPALGELASPVGSSESVLTVGGGDSGSESHLNRTCHAHLCSLPVWTVLFSWGKAWSWASESWGAVSEWWLVKSQCWCSRLGLELSGGFSLRPAMFCMFLHPSQTCARPILPKYT